MSRVPVHLSRVESSVQLNELFIKKIMKHKPWGCSYVQWTEMLFGIDERFIVQYEAVRDFKLPGLYKPVPFVRIEGFKIDRMVRQGKRIWVRFDTNYPNVIELEAPIGQNLEPEIYQLTKNDWERIRTWLSPVNPSDIAFHEKTA